MELFDYLMSKKGHNTYKDLFSYLLGKGTGGSGTYTTFSGISLNISNTVFGKIKNFMLNSTQLTQNGTPTPDNPVDINVIKGSNNIKIANSDDSEEQNYPISLASNNLVDINKIEENKNIFASGAILNSNAHNTTDYIYVGNYENYTISFESEATSTWNFCYFDENKNVVSGGINGLSSHEVYRTVPSGAKYIRFSYPKNSTKLMLAEGTNTTYEPYYNIEYCKIGDYADQLFKNTADSPYYDNTLVEGDWYLKKSIKKINSYNGETISTIYMSTTGGLETGATIYYGLSTPTYIHITTTDYPILHPQLENLYNNATSYNEQTNITQTNDDLSFNISVDVLVKN